MKLLSTPAFKRTFDERAALLPQITEAADLLYAAGRDNTQVAAGDLAKFASGELDDAYAVQHLNIRRALDSGANVIGHKVGLTSEAMQRQLGVTEPDSGILLDRMMLANDSVVAAGTFFQPRVEAEFGVVILADFPAGPSPDEAAVRDGISGTFLALEILETRYPSWLISLWQSIADNASCGAAVAGPVTQAVPVDRLKDQRIDIFVDGFKADTGFGHAVLGDPVKSVLWLAERLHRAGLGLHEGDLVITGSVHASIGLDGVSEVRAVSSEYEDVRLRFE
ncbi:fumarylacetoacetate hydrolase family protein [Amycolatopsis coloradensis]|uniref:Fumarylacetoacetate hydrolase family protein n=1 Tax=Amycolatopsis coloradensis TaxID=76021 RepID=A0ACD5BJF0_9PSEU